MVPTHVRALKRVVGWPELWSMRNVPSPKTALSTVLLGCSTPPSLNTPVTMMAPGPAWLVDATWKYSARPDDAGAEPPQAPPGPPQAPPGPKGPPPAPPGPKGPSHGPSLGMVVAVAAVVVAVVLADEMPVATANAAPDTRPAASTSVADRDSLHLGAIR